MRPRSIAPRPQTSTMHGVRQRPNKRKRPLTQDQKLALIGRLRIGDLNTLFLHRYRSTVYPDDDDGRHSLSIILHHYARNNPMKVTKIIKAHAPWMPQNEIDELLTAIADKPKSWHAKTIGIELNFTPSEWRELRLRTIAPVDMTKEERRRDGNSDDPPRREGASGERVAQHRHRRNVGVTSVICLVGANK
jgi:hypothetical protein